jgi:signal peptidase II
MKQVPGSRYVVFVLITGAALYWDLFSKDVVFDDLGYPGGVAAPVAKPGRHTIFDRPRFFEGESVPYLTGWMTFRLLTSFNHGALWGVGQGYSWAFASLSVLAVVGILYWLFVRRAAASLWLTVALAFVLAGTLGNLYDRAGLHGYAHSETGKPIYAVRDFLLFTFGEFSWPVFNFADTYLVTGAIMLVLQSFREERGKGAKGQSGKVEEGEIGKMEESGKVA